MNSHSLSLSLSLSIECTLPRTLHISGSLQVKNWKLIYHDENCQHPKLRGQYLYRIYTTHFPTISHGKYHHIVIQSFYIMVCVLESCFENGYCFIEVIEPIQIIQYWFVMSARTHVYMWCIYTFTTFTSTTFTCSFALTLHLHLHLHLLHVHTACTFTFTFWCAFTFTAFTFTFKSFTLHCSLYIYIYMYVCVSCSLLDISWFSVPVVLFPSCPTSRPLEVLSALLLASFRFFYPVSTRQSRNGCTRYKYGRILLQNAAPRFYCCNDAFTFQFPYNLVLRPKNNPDGITISPHDGCFFWKMTTQTSQKSLLMH